MWWLFCVFQFNSLQLHIPQAAGGEETKSKTKVSARGSVDTKAGKDMVGEMLDASVAQLKDVPKKKKEKKDPKEKKVDSPQEKAAKDVAKDIKM